MMRLDEIKVWVYNIERFAIHDGPGIRTVVFLQGCPLKCEWCANPESQKRGPHLMHLEEKCVGCGCCVKTCPQGAISMINGKAVVDRNRCICCNNCVQTCLYQVNKIVGRQMNLQEIYDVVVRDIAYYEASDGGVTFSGGEPLLYAEELTPLLRALKERYISVAFETCGNVSFEQFQRVMPYTDYFLYDIKSLKEDILRKHTNGDLSLIGGNLERLALDLPGKIVLRAPVIPGVNNSPDDIRRLFEEAKRLRFNRIDLLPYHTLGMIKYRQLGMPYNCDCKESLPPKELLPYEAMGKENNLEIHIGG